MRSHARRSTSSDVAYEMRIAGDRPNAAPCTAATERGDAEGAGQVWPSPSCARGDPSGRYSAARAAWTGRPASSKRYSIPGLGWSETVEPSGIATLPGWRTMIGSDEPMSTKR